MPGKGRFIGIPPRDNLERRVLRWSEGELTLFRFDTGKPLARARIHGAPGYLNPEVHSSSLFAVTRFDGSSALFDWELNPLQQLRGELVGHPRVEQFAVVGGGRAPRCTPPLWDAW